MARDSSIQLAFCSSTDSPTWVHCGWWQKLPTFRSSAMAIPSAFLCQDHICLLLSLSLERQAALKHASGLHLVFLTTLCSSCNVCCNTPHFRQDKRKILLSKSHVHSNVNNMMLTQWNWQRNFKKEKHNFQNSLSGTERTRLGHFEWNRSPQDRCLWTRTATVTE